MSTRIDRCLAVALLLALPMLMLYAPNEFYMSMLIYGMINSMAAIGLCLMLGFAGQISLGQAAFFGIGAYVATWLIAKLGASGLEAMLTGALAAMACGWLISRPLSRLSDHYLAMATLVFGSLVYMLFANATSITGGLDPGISISEVSILGMDMFVVQNLFFVTWVMLIFIVVLAGNVASGRIGRSLRAIKMSSPAAASVGIDVVRSKAFVFAISAFMTGIAGALYAFYARAFNASSFNVGYAIELLMMVVIGSLNRISGAIVGAFIITLLPVVFENFEDYKTLVFGLVMVFIMKVTPDGLIDGLFGLVMREKKR